jgi:hypothetical protein
MSNYASLDKRLALLEQKLDTIEHNHLKHIQDDLSAIKKWFGWGIGVIFVQLLAVIASMMM